MMTLQQTVEIPPDRRLFIDVPPEIPVGRGTLTFTPAQAVENRQRRVRKQTVIEALKNEAAQKAVRRFTDPSGDALQRFCGSLAHIYTEDGVAIQRKMRDEWER